MQADAYICFILRYAYKCIQAYASVCIDVNTHPITNYAHASICMHMHTYECICIHMLRHACACICRHMNTYAHMCIHMKAYVYQCRYMHRMRMHSCPGVEREEWLIPSPPFGVPHPLGGALCLALDAYVLYIYILYRNIYQGWLNAVSCRSVL